MVTGAHSPWRVGALDGGVAGDVEQVREKESSDKDMSFVHQRQGGSAQCTEALADRCSRGRMSIRKVTKRVGAVGSCNSHTKKDVAEKCKCVQRKKGWNQSWVW